MMVIIKKDEYMILWTLPVENVDPTEGIETFRSESGDTIFCSSGSILREPS